MVTSFCVAEENWSFGASIVVWTNAFNLIFFIRLEINFNAFEDTKHNAFQLERGFEVCVFLSG